MRSDASPLPYGRPGSRYTLPAKRRRIPIVGVLVAVGLLALLVIVILPAMCGSREIANRVKCASNMKQIALAAIIWANDHGGKFPDDLDTIVRQGDVVPAVFNCPSSPDAPAQGATTQAVIDELHQAGHLSYVYVGKGLTMKSPADVVVLYELPNNHKDDDMSVASEFRSGEKVHGMNVVCADGHAEWLGVEEARAIYKQVADGVFPVRLPGSGETGR